MADKIESLRDLMGAVANEHTDMVYRGADFVDTYSFHLMNMLIEIACDRLNEADYIAKWLKPEEQ